MRYIRKDNIEAAQQVAVEISRNLEKLPAFPNIGRIGQKTGTRELNVPPYVVVYRVGKDFIEALRIWHGAQNR